jgi:Inner membrane protein YgaP-like, transmembrane domain
MTVDNGIRVFAGTMILISVALVTFVSPWWLLMTTFIGIQLIQSAFTGFCPPAFVLRKLGCKEAGVSCGTNVQ